MAETVTIEIPVSVTDNTSSGLQSAQKNITAFDKSVQRTEQRMKNMDISHDIELTATDRASDVMDDIEANADTLDGANPDVDIGVDDAATDTIHDVMGAADELDGMDPDVDLGADDAASDVIGSAADAAETFGGMSETAEISVDDTATDEIASAADAAETFGGMSETAEISANDSASSVISNVVDQAESWGKGVYTGTLNVAGSALALLGISASVSDTISTYETFEATMSEVEAISGATGSALQSLTDKAKEMGSTTKFTATEAGEAMTYMAMAGWESEDMLSGISGIMNLAAASGEDLATTSDIVTDALTAFGLAASDSDHFADVLATTAASANTTVSGMGETFKYVGSMAGTLGYSIEDVALMTGLMANSGIKGSMAGTSLNTIFTRLSTNANGAADAIEELGINFYDETGSARDLSDVIDELRIATADYTDEQKTSLAKTIAGTQAQKGLLAILNASEEDYNSLADAISNADGSAASMADTMLDNMQGSLTLMNSALDGVKTSVGERLAPYVTAAADMITELAPDIEETLNTIMDNVDTAASHIKLKWGEMTSTEEWQNADFFGKIDIAWDTIIGQPFLDWATTDGVSLISDGIYNLFSDAVKILPGGDNAGLTSWLSAGLLGLGGSFAIGKLSSVISGLGKVATNISAISTAATEATSLGGFMTSLSSITSPALLAAAGIAGVATAIIAINGAIDEYNTKQINANLEEHFGNITLDTSEVEALAGTIIPVDIIADLQLADTTFNEADELVSSAEDLLAETQYINWKVHSVKIDLTDADADTLVSNADEFVEDIKSSLEKKEYAAELTVTALLGDVDSEEIVSKMQDWFSEDYETVSTLGDAVTDLLQKSIDEGAYNVETATAIEIMQQKMLDIANGAAKAELQGQLDWLTITSSGAALDADSWSAVVEQIGEYQQELVNADTSDYQSVLGYLRQLENNDSSRSEEIQTIRDAIAEAYSQTNNMALTEGWSWMYQSMSDAYGAELESAEANLSSSTDKWLSYYQNEMQIAANGGDPSQALEAITTNALNVDSGLDNATKGALLDRYETMLPTVEELEKVIDGAYGENGEQLYEIPSAIMDAYNQAMEIGAAAGDSSAISAYMARQIAESYGSKEDYLKELEEAGLTFEMLPEALQEGINRAFSETTDLDYSGFIEGLSESLAGQDVDWAEVEALLNEYGLSIADALEEQGIDLGDGTVPVKTDDMQFDMGELSEQLDFINEQLGDLGTVEGQVEGDIIVKVDKGDCLSQIGEAVGVDWREIAEYNGIEDPYTIYPDMEIKIPADQIEVDTSEVAGAVDGALDGEGGEAEGTSYSTKVLVEAGEVNTDDAKSEAEQEIDDTFAETYETDGDTDITYTQSNNAAEIYDEAAGEVQTYFNTSVPVSGSAVITMSYSISNPSATIQLSSGGTASATISASVSGYASGGEVGLSGAELIMAGEEGLEYIIPTTPGRRERGIALWQEAGQALGILDAAGNITAYANGGTVGDDVSAMDAIIPVSNDDEQAVWTVDGRKRSADEDKSEGSATVSVANQQGGGTTVEVNVEMNPVITIESDGMDEDKVFEVLKDRVREVADDLGDEIAERMSKIFANMPVTEEAS